jgi:hypothetical protein
MDCPAILGAATVAKGAVVANNLQSRRSAVLIETQQKEGSWTAVALCRNGLVDPAEGKSLRSFLDE